MRHPLWYSPAPLITPTTILSGDSWVILQQPWNIWWARRMPASGPLYHCCLEYTLWLFSCLTPSFWRRKWPPTPVFLPGESQDRGAWRATVQGCKELNMIEAPEHACTHSVCYLSPTTSTRAIILPFAHCSITSAWHVMGVEECLWVKAFVSTAADCGPEGRWRAKALQLAKVTKSHVLKSRAWQLLGDDEPSRATALNNAPFRWHIPSTAAGRELWRHWTNPQGHRPYGRLCPHTLKATFHSPMTLCLKSVLKPWDEHLRCCHDGSGTPRPVREIADFASSVQRTPGKVGAPPMPHGPESPSRTSPSLLPHPGDLRECPDPAAESWGLPTVQALCRQNSWVKQWLQHLVMLWHWPRYLQHSGPLFALL